MKRRTFTAGAALVAVAGLLGTPSAQAGGSYIACAPNVNVFVWDGGGDGMSWNDGLNWDVDCTPGPFVPNIELDPPDDVVSIPSGADVEIGNGESAYVLELHNEGSLTITHGGVLATINDSESDTTLLQGLLFGFGRFTVTDAMTWDSTLNGAATMSTRRCLTPPDAPMDNCPGIPAMPGVTVIDEDATLAISGRGVNLVDGRVIENHGNVVLTGDGYIAADYGSAFRNLRLAGDLLPKFVIDNDRGYYQGFPETGQVPSDFVNTGRVIKQSGTGTSVIDAGYAKTDLDSPYTGGVTVLSGRMTVLSPSGSFTNDAFVKQGAAFANGSPPGGCAVGTPACETIDVTPGDPQAAALALIKVGAKSRKVTLQELDAAANPRGFGSPVYVSSPNAVATTADPMVLRIYLDAATLGASVPVDVAQLAKVQRKASAAATYQALPDCAVTGGATSTQACVDRAESLAETNAAGGDVIIVVETLQNSRYRVGRLRSVP